MNGLTKKEEHCRDYYHSGVRWRPGVGGWPIQNTTEWAAAAAPKTVAKAITNNYKSPTDWILFEIKVAPTEYYLLTWSAGCWASGGPPACCPPPSPRRGSLFHITTSPINIKGVSEISRNTIVFFSVYRPQMLRLLHSPLPSSVCPRPVPRTVSALGFPTQKQSVPDPATQLPVKLAMQSYEHVRIGHTNPLLMWSQSPKASVPKAVIVTATGLHSPSSVPGSGSAMSAAGRQRPGPGPE